MLLVVTGGGWVWACHGHIILSNSAKALVCRSLLRLTAEQLIAQGKTDADLRRVIEVTQPTCHRWRQQYGGMQAEEARRMTQMEKENARLKTLLAEAVSGPMAPARRCAYCLFKMVAFSYMTLSRSSAVPLA